MNSFWNKITVSILVCVIVLPIITVIFSFIFAIEGWGIANAITLCALFITILSTLYSNYKSDERVEKQIKTSEEQFKKQLGQNEKNLKEQLLFNKKQEIYIKLYKDLNDYWELLDTERVGYCLTNYSDYEPFRYISYDDFSQIHKIIINFNLSPDFLYMPQEIQDIAKKFLKFVDNNLEHYDYYKYEDTKNYYSALEILSAIFPILKQEIGLKK